MGLIVGGITVPPGIVVGPGNVLDVGAAVVAGGVSAGVTVNAPSPDAALAGLEAGRATGANPQTSFYAKYEVLEKIGGGGEARIFLIRDKTTGEHFVARRSRKPEKVKDMLREIGALQSLDHPNVVRIREWFQERDASWAGAEEVIIITEFIAGAKSLGQLIAEHRRYTEEELQSIHDQILAGLKAVHARGIVHRDINPKNILIREGTDGIRVTIIDFGSVRLLGEETHLSTLGVVGTIYWMSPEQLEGGKITPATDIFGLGLTIAALATGRMRTNTIQAEPVAETIAILQSLARQGVLSAGFVRQLAMEMDADPRVRMQALGLSRPAAAIARVPAVFAGAPIVLARIPGSADGAVQFLSVLECARALAASRPVPSLGGGLARIVTGSMFLIGAVIPASLITSAYPPILIAVMGGLSLLLGGGGALLINVGVSDLRDGTKPDSNPESTAFYYRGGGYSNRRTLGNRRHGKRILPVEKIDRAAEEFDGYLLLNGFIVTGSETRYSVMGGGIDRECHYYHHIRLEGEWNGERIVIERDYVNEAPHYAIREARKGNTLYMLVERQDDGSLEIIDAGPALRGDMPQTPALEGGGEVRGLLVSGTPTDS